ncbi:uncharacterized protein LOC132300146 [Cornus florida]|uniref:uncharacterized protein LOC132300146 n=1 Tax=Cornus florida TaxID=4283 RepID=UPI002896E671|nr:uncharacterized protein LOC132300146 [Cornus florida]
MDLETENRIAAILVKEAAELRRQAEKEGIHVYLGQPKVRGRPNSRFLTTTVLGVQQANRSVEVNEMWRARQKELELDERLRGRSKEESSSSRSHRNVSDSSRNTSKRHADHEVNASAPSLSSKGGIQDCYSRDDEGLRDAEIEEFLHSRVKRGRGTVGSRMDETGPYLPRSSDGKGKLLDSNLRVGEEWENRAVLGPAKPSSLESCESSEEESSRGKRKKSKKVGSGSSSKHRSRKHTKEKSRDKLKKKREKEKRSKHHR